MRIGEAATASGLDASAIRFYEASGVVPEPARSANGYRSYGSDDVDLLRFVMRLRTLRLPLDDVREIVALHVRGEAPCREVRDAIDREVDTIEARLADLQRLRSELVALQVAAADVVDEWPRHCVCHIVDGTG